MKYTYNVLVHVNGIDKDIEETYISSISYRKDESSMSKLGTDLGKAMRKKYPSMKYADIIACFDEENNPY
jgi:hypothetical protein